MQRSISACSCHGLCSQQGRTPTRTAKRLEPCWHQINNNTHNNKARLIGNSRGVFYTSPQSVSSKAHDCLKHDPELKCNVNCAHSDCKLVENLHSRSITSSVNAAEQVFGVEVHWKVWVRRSWRCGPHRWVVQRLDRIATWHGWKSIVSVGSTYQGSAKTVHEFATTMRWH